MNKKIQVSKKEIFLFGANGPPVPQPSVLSFEQVLKKYIQIYLKRAKSILLFAKSIKEVDEIYRI